jgi:hypothetical protein
MEKEITSIICPRCGEKINVSDILYHQVQDQLKKEFDEQSAEKDKEYQQNWVN